MEQINSKAGVFMDYDIVIIGGGPGGYTAAIRAAQLGAKAALIEKDSLGGTCLNRGCIPTKTLYRNAEILNILSKADDFGIYAEGLRFDIEKMQQRKENVINQLRGGIYNLLKANNVDIINGAGSLKDKNTVEVIKADGILEELTAKNIIIAAGSKPSKPPIEGADSKGVYSSEDMLNFKKVPDKLLIIGGGVIGMEFAGIFKSLGSMVTVIEFMPGILMQVDTDITKRYSVLLKKQGIDVYTSTKVTKIEKTGESFIVHTEGKKGEASFEADQILIAAGRSPLIEGLNIDKLGISYDKKGISVDEDFMTNIEGIYAIGDVNGISMLAHAASHQGIHAVEKIMGINKENKSPIPGCIFVFPEIASVGITEQQAKENGLKYKTSKFLFGGNGKALALGETDGLVKVIASEDGVILGVHIMGPHASDLIQEGTLAVSIGMKADEIGDIIHAHPTLSEAFHEAVLGIEGLGIHSMPVRKR